MGLYSSSAIDPIEVLTPSLSFTSENWSESQPIVIAPGGIQEGEDEEFDESQMYRLLLEMRSDKRPDLRKMRFIDIYRTDEGPAGLSPTFPIVLIGGNNGLQIIEAGSLAAADVIIDPIEIGDPLQTPEEPGTAMFFNISTARSVRINVAACSDEAPLVVAIYNNSKAEWISNVDCSNEGNLECVAMDNVQACSGFIGLQLNGADGTVPEPFTISIQTADGSEADFALMIAQVSPEGLLFGNSPGNRDQVLNGMG